MSAELTPCSCWACENEPAPTSVNVTVAPPVADDVALRAQVAQLAWWRRPGRVVET